MKYLIAIVLATISFNAYASATMQVLMGTLDTTYHIRTDILDNINASYPAFSNKWKALIRIAQNQHFIYYESNSYAEAEKAVEENSIAQRCLNLEYNDSTESYDQFKMIESMMGDTQDRRDHIFNVSAYYFSRRVFAHPKISKNELKDKCNSGNYG